MSHREEAQGTTQDTLEGLCLSAGLGTPWALPGGAGGGVWGEGRLGVSAESAAPTTRSRIKQKTTTGRDTSAPRTRLNTKDRPTDQTGSSDRSVRTVGPADPRIYPHINPAEAAPQFERILRFAKRPAQTTSP
ncbi:hypothetical protein AMECASPLE_015728 [Ameca splendens]|uniref:Uncharacterized protein n=1 Tax=Ameca splendens TaxID=208324 RepID=A0ABV0Z0K5_9TELE